MSWPVVLLIGDRDSPPEERLRVDGVPLVGQDDGAGPRGRDDRRPPVAPDDDVTVDDQMADGLDPGQGAITEGDAADVDGTE